MKTFIKNEIVSCRYLCHHQSFNLISLNLIKNIYIDHCNANNESSKLRFSFFQGLMTGYYLPADFVMVLINTQPRLKYGVTSRWLVTVLIPGDWWVPPPSRLSRNKRRRVISSRNCTEIAMRNEFLCTCSAHLHK